MFADQPQDAYRSRTGSLGLEFWQHDKRVNLVESEDHWSVHLDPNAFEMRVPQVDTDPINMVNWIDHSIFSVQEGEWVGMTCFDKAASDGTTTTEMEPHDTNQYFGCATSMATSVYNSENIALNNEAHSYFTDTRLIKGPDYSGVRFSTYSYAPGTQQAESNPEDSKERPLVGLDGRTVYSVVWIDKNKDQKVDIFEYEYLTLDF
jgi:hypothetical protein